MAVARQVKQIFQQTPGVVDTDWYMQDPQPQLNFHVDEAKAALHGIPVAEVAQTLALATSGAQAGLLHVAELARTHSHDSWNSTGRSALLSRALENIRLRGADGSMVSLRELVDVEHTTLEPDIYHKNLKRVVYVTGDVAGAEESPVYAIMKMNRRSTSCACPTATLWPATTPRSRNPPTTTQ